MAPAVIAALVGAAAALIPKVASWFGKDRWNSYADSVTGARLTGAQREANAFTADQAQKQMYFQQQMRDSQYQAGVTDMLNAGLNPALMYGSGASGNVAPSGAMGSSVSPGSPDSGLIGQIASLALLGSQIRNLDANTNKTITETDLTKQNIVKSASEIEQIKANISKTGLESQSLEIVNKYLDRKENVALQNMTLEGDKLAAEWTEIQQKISNLKTEQSKMLQDIAESSERVNYLLSQQNLNSAQIDEIRANISKINAECDLLIKETDLTEKDIEFYEWNHGSEVNIAGYRPGTRQIPRNPKDSKINVNPIKKGSYKIIK